MAENATIDIEAKCPAKAGKEIPEHGTERLLEHTPSPELVEEGEIAVRTVCTDCGGVAEEWENEEAYLEEARAGAIDFCPNCGETAVEGQVRGKVDDGQVWHYGCWLEAEHGYDHIPRDADVDRPWSSNADAEFNYHREVETQIGDETYTWDEWEINAGMPDHGKHNLPTRSDLSPDQLETLREWALQSEHRSEAGTHGTLPAKFILVGGYRTDFPEMWICPDCGDLVEPKEDYNIDITAQCDNCESDRWITHGEPLTGKTKRGKDALSDREREAVFLTQMCDTHAEVAENMDIELSTVRQYLGRAREKAIRGKDLHEMLVSFDLLDE